MKVFGTFQIRQDQAATRKWNPRATPQAAETDTSPAALVHISPEARRAILKLQERPDRQTGAGLWHAPSRLFTDNTGAASTVSRTPRPVTDGLSKGGSLPNASSDAPDPTVSRRPILRLTDTPEHGPSDAETPVVPPIILTLPGDKPSPTASRG